MNQLLIVLDAVPYNVFRKAKTSNMRKIGEIGYAYSPAQWTLPSVISMFHIPYYLGKPIVIVEHYNHREWLPIQLKNGGYKTSIVVDNPWFVRYRDFIGRGFDNYIAMNSISAKSILNKGKEFLDPKFFTVLWITETHYPYWERKGRSKGALDEEEQIRVIEHVDRLLKNFLPKVPEGTHILITSDHGDSYDGYKSLGHNPQQLTDFDRNLFKVPYIRGKV